MPLIFAIAEDLPRTGRVAQWWRPRVALLAGALLLVACGGAGPERREYQLLVFGGPLQLDIVSDDGEAADAAVADIVASMALLEQDWHPWRPSALTRINDACRAGTPIEAPASLVGLLLRAQELAPLSDGLFDPALGGLVALWGFHTSSYPVTTPAPDLQQVQAWLAGAPRVSQVQVDGVRVHCGNPAVQLDFGAMAEGAAGELVVAALERAGISSALVNLGGDVIALGDAGGRPWRIGIRDPFGGVLAGIDLQAGEALFSSGNYNKFRGSDDGERWPHVLDPRSGMPVTHTAAASVVHSDPVLADVAATALMVGGPARFAELVGRMATPCALLLTVDNELMITDAMSRRVQLERQPVRLGEPVVTTDGCSAGRPAE